MINIKKGFAQDGSTNDFNKNQSLFNNYTISIEENVNSIKNEKLTSNCSFHWHTVATSTMFHCITFGALQIYQTIKRLNVVTVIPTFIPFVFVNRIIMITIIVLMLIV